MLFGFENSEPTKYFLFRELIHAIDVVKFCNVLYAAYTKCDTTFTNSIVSFIKILRFRFESLKKSGRVGFKTRLVSSGPVWISIVLGRVGVKINPSCLSLAREAFPS